MIRGELVRVKNGELADPSQMRRSAQRKLGHTYSIVYTQPDSEDVSTAWMSIHQCIVILQDTHQSGWKYCNHLCVTIQTKRFLHTPRLLYAGAVLALVEPQMLSHTSSKSNVPKSVGPVLEGLSHLYITPKCEEMGIFGHAKAFFGLAILVFCVGAVNQSSRQSVKPRR